VHYFRHACGELPSELAALAALFNAHVLEFAGLEDFAALHTLDEFSFFVAAYDLHTWVFAGLLVL
jgi:hypothetical protein